MLDRGLVPLVAVTYECAQYSRCAYCYAKSQQNSPPMSLDTFREISRMFLELGVTELTLLGGEPTQHPQFTQLVDVSQELGLKLRIFTNGLLGNRVRSCLLQADNLEDLFFHFEPRYYEGRSNSEIAYWRNVEEFAKQAPRIWLRWNISSPDAPVGEVVDRAANLGANIAYSISTPSYGYDSEYVSIEQHKLFRETVLHLWRAADASGVQLALGRPLPLCMFDPSEVSKVMARSDFEATCNAIDDVTVNPDGSLQLCSVLYTEQVGRPGDVAELKQLLNVLRAKEASVRREPSAEICKPCGYWRDGMCQGGCLTYKLYAKDKQFAVPCVGAKKETEMIFGPIPQVGKI